jgi:hypothetical protein
VATLVLYLRTTVVVASSLWQLNEAAGTPSDSTTICTLGKSVATNKYLFMPGQTNATALGTSYPAAIQSQGWVSQNPYTGDIAAGSWKVTHRIGTSYTTKGAVGVCAVRVWRCTAQDLSGTNTIVTPTGSGSGWNESPSVSLNVSLQTVNQTITGVSNTVLNGEYLYAEFIWNITTASSSNSQNVNMSIQNTDIYQVDTTAFTSISAESLTGAGGKLQDAFEKMRIPKLVESLSGTGGKALDALTRSAILEKRIGEAMTAKTPPSLGSIYADLIAFKIPGGVNTMSLSEAMTLLDALAAAQALSRAFQEQFTLLDVLAKSVASRKLMTESVSLADSFIRSTALERRLSESITLADAMVRQASIQRSMAETATLLDALTTFKGHVSEQDLSEVITLLDQVIRSVFIQRAMSESEVLLDQLAKSRALERRLSESMVLADVLARSQTIGRSFTESLRVTDALARPTSLQRAFQEQAILLDILVASKGQVIAQWNFSETAILIDALTRRALIQRSMSEQETLLDVFTIITLVRALIGEGTPFTDSFIRSTALERRLSESVAMSDALAKYQRLQRPFAEAIATLDTLYIQVTRNLIEEDFTESFAFGVAADSFTLSPLRFGLAEIVQLLDQLSVSVVPGLLRHAVLSRLWRGS